MTAAPREPGAGPRAPVLDVAIVGGGIAGLVTAYRLSRNRESKGRLSVCLFESRDRLGGVIRTEQVVAEEQGHCLCEAGPDSMVTAKTTAIDLCRELGLDAAFARPRSLASFSVVHERRLHPLPKGFHLIAPTEPRHLLGSGLFTWRGKLRMLLEPRFQAAPGDIDEWGRDHGGDESVESFVRRRFGREAFERAAEPILGGLFAADATRLSADRALAPFVELERRVGSVLRGLRHSPPPTGPIAARTPAHLSLEGGLRSLVERLGNEIPASWLELGCGATRLRRRPGGPWQVETTRGTWLARSVVLACPAPRAGELLKEAASTLTSALAGLRFASCATVHLVYRRGDVPLLPTDFGFFVPRREPYHILAATYASEKFSGRAPAGFHLVRTVQGGALDPEATELEDETLVGRSHGDLARLIGINGKPVAWSVHRLRESVPQFDVGHRTREADLLREVERQGGLLLAGSAHGAYGLADCVASAESVAARISRCRQNGS